MSHYAQLELLTNLLWVLLGIPAWFLWRRDCGKPAPKRWFHVAGPAVVLGAALVLLFPFVSATDDMHAIGPDMEESSSPRRSVSDGRGGKNLASAQHAPVAFRACAATANPSFEAVGVVRTASTHSPEPVHLSRYSGRAPPVFAA